MAFLDSISNIAGAASNKVGQLSTIAKGALCIPSIISGLSTDGIKKLAGAVAGSIASAIQGSISAVTDLALGAVQDQVNKLTGAINGLISTATGLVATIAGTIETAKQFYQNIKAQILDIKDFIDTKENCQFAAASLANCIISESINNLSLKAVKDISSGLGSIDNKVSELSNKISEPVGAINNFMDKGSKQLNKAASVISAAKLI
jgi:hypothetical protein|tara:strand:+ start:293 stop:910 length:618 start_codon:yes stop_codon:yes gene_type:complete